MPSEEMTITLDDVSTLLGIPIIDRFVSLPIKRLSDREAIILLIRELGVSHKQVADKITGARSRSIRMEWLRDLFGRVTDFSDGTEIECVERAYLFLLDCTLFCNKFVTRVLITYLKLLSDLATV